MCVRNGVLNKITKTRLEREYGLPLYCARCGVFLSVGDEITTVYRRNKRGYHNRRYHKKCFEELYVSVEEDG